MEALAASYRAAAIDMSGDGRLHDPPAPPFNTCFDVIKNLWYEGSLTMREQTIIYFDWR